jgi:quercetin dioxygenase-like cupin family protein
MENRRAFLGLASAWLLPVGFDAQAPAPRARGVLARHSLTGPLAGFDVVLLDASRSPGPAPVHRHPGVVLGYVLEGQLRFAINHEPGQVVPAGGTFFEPIGAVHTMNESASPDADARFLAFFVVPTGSGLTGAGP